MCFLLSVSSFKGIKTSLKTITKKLQIDKYCGIPIFDDLANKKMAFTTAARELLDVVDFHSVTSLASLPFLRL